MSFVDKIRGSKKPSSATFEEWDAWEAEAKAKYPLRFWIVETFIPGAEDFLEAPYSLFKKVQIWYVNRFISKTHALTSRNLERGQYHEIDTRILHCLFDTLTDFVECELASLATMLDGFKHSSADASFPKRKKRCQPEAGIAHLKWETTLVYDYVPPEDECYGKPTPQAQAAQEILELYTWWTSVRPSRVDPDSLPDRKERFQLEKTYLDEDQKMLHRLIDIRSSLWT